MAGTMTKGLVRHIARTRATLRTQEQQEKTEWDNVVHSANNDFTARPRVPTPAMHGFTKTRSWSSAL